MLKFIAAKISQRWRIANSEQANREQLENLKILAKAFCATSYASIRLPTSAHQMNAIMASTIRQERL
jgi:hypothetical protein